MSYKDLYFSFSGRIPRGTYWVKFVLPAYVLNTIAGGLDVMVATRSAETGEATMGLFRLGASALLIWPSIAVALKRAHDRNREWWFLLLGLIPFVNLWVSAELGFMRGVEGENKFGPDPSGSASTTSAASDWSKT